MPFDSLEWVNLADTLAANGDEASFRAAIGRYYYAVFVKSRDTLSANGLLTVSHGDGDHRAVVEALNNNKRGAAGQALNSLRRGRNTADYDTTLPVSRSDVSRAKHQAAEVQRICKDDW